LGIRTIFWIDLLTRPLLLSKLNSIVLGVQIQMLTFILLTAGRDANRSVRTPAREAEDGARRDKKHASQKRSLRKVCRELFAKLEHVK